MLVFPKRLRNALLFELIEFSANAIAERIRITEREKKELHILNNGAFILVTHFNHTATLQLTKFVCWLNSYIYFRAPYFYSSEVDDNAF